MSFDRKFVELLKDRLGGFKYEWTTADLTQVFAPPSYFDDLSSARPCMLIGARGSGKTTALLGMTRLARGEADSKHNNDLLAVYERVDSGKTSAFSGAGVPDSQWDKIFSHYLNLSICCRLILEIKECKNPSSEEQDYSSVIELLRITPQEPEPCNLKITIEILRRALVDLENALNDIQALDGIPLSILLEPIRELSSIAKQLLGFSRIIYIFDEYENFDERQQRIVNTIIKHCTPAFVVKIGLKDYGLKTRDVLAKDQRISHLADYVQLRISEIFTKQQFRDFSLRVLELRLQGRIPSGKSIAELFESLSLEEEYDRSVETSIKVRLENVFAGLQREGELSLLQKRFLLLESEFRGQELLELIQRWFSDDRSLKIRFGNYSYAIVLSDSKAKKNADGVKKLYPGIHTLADLAGANIRYFLELVYESVSEQYRRDPTSEFIAAEAQSIAAQRVGRRALENATDGALHGPAIKGIVIGIGRVLENLARGVHGRRPEVTTFRIRDPRPPARIEDSLFLVRECIREGLFIEAPITKRSGSHVPMTQEYRIHPILSPFLGISHRKKRCIDIYADEIQVLAQDTERGIKVIESRLRLGGVDDSLQSDFFSAE
ncbi:hypothetical protein OKA05_14070 [Luteolibacter arcticus]|uniref:ATP-binding protein n=1 Tax=Luteolibacter arcticus TaxID=1581411 RepID=A0ABT3GJI8_9BACT|nr:hypothetical protein [Luteolibacter arcticus]MCW1923688.1 hypothetical protein [Luteolibacter arcticus]